MKKLFGIILGAVLIAAGVIFALEELGISHFNFSFEGWWTVFIILPSLYDLVTSKDKTGNLIFLLVGVYLLLAARNIIDYSTAWKLLLPAIIVVVGIKLIIKTVMGENEPTAAENLNENSECVTIFGTKEEDYSGKDIKALKVGALFGGTKCNLTNTNFDETSHIDLFCMFGGVDIVIPKNVQIKVNAFCLFGGITDKRVVGENIEKTATVTINGFCMFGGAEII